MCTYKTSGLIKNLSYSLITKDRHPEHSNTTSSLNPCDPALWYPPVTSRPSLSLSGADSRGSDCSWEHTSLSMMLYVRREGYWLEGDKVIAGMTWILYLLCSFPPSSFTLCLFVLPLPFLFPRQPGWWWHHIHMSDWGERQREIDVLRCVWENKTGWRKEKATQ